jgi:hypothetical protein
VNKTLRLVELGWSLRELPTYVTCVLKLPGNFFRLSLSLFYRVIWHKAILSNALTVMEHTHH